MVGGDTENPVLKHLTSYPNYSYWGAFLQYVRAIPGRLVTPRTDSHNCEFAQCGMDREPGWRYCAFHKRKVRGIGSDLVTPFRFNGAAVQ